MHAHMQPFLACMHAGTNTHLLVLVFWGILNSGEPALNIITNILFCASVVHHNDKVQRVSSQEAITGPYTSLPVSPAFCLSADAVKPSIFPPSFTCFLPSIPPLLWLSLYRSLIYCV